MKFIVGLGNPGEAYARSRHNVGFLAVDLFAASHSFPAGRRKLQVHYTQQSMDGETVFLLKPETYMNRSGPAVRELVSYFGGEEEPGIDDIIVVLDDLDLAVGRLRFRAQGSSGGHRGMQSVIEAFGTNAIHRLKIGVGRPGVEGAADYVLERLHGRDEEELLDGARKATTALKTWIVDGIDACANRFNGPESSQDR